MDPSTPKVLDKKTRMAGIDVITSLFVMAVSIAVAHISIEMPRPGDWKSAPGLIPLLFAVTLFLMGLGLFISALQRKGFAVLGRMLSGITMGGFAADMRTQRTLWIILLAGIYILLLTGWLPFELAGSLFLFGTFAVFWRKGGWLKIVLVAVTVPMVFGFTLRMLFSILLPGNSIFDLLF
ncbi:MAG: tripartite tricarboxylate transporter TctB family protein [Thermodesulfobacteriota bacterium]